MKKHLTLLLLMAALFCPFILLSQPCSSSQTQLKVIIVPDNYPNESSWNIKDLNGTVILSGTVNSDSVCVPNNQCFRFTMYDSYGDGICCQHGNGSYTVYVNGIMAGTGGDFDYQESVDLNCPPGTSCSSAITVPTGNHIAPQPNYWYKFIPDSTGMYKISTCGLNVCDTKLWIYDHCAGLNWDSTNIGTILYNDDAQNCAPQSEIEAQFMAGAEYIIRVGSHGNSCSSLILWNIQYIGPIVGCMDPTACNFNPLATVADTNCIYPGDPLCPNGPDLIVVESAIQTTMQLSTLTASNCHVVEDCMTGYGSRTIIRFTTHIKNIGNQDYYIGNPNANPGQFTYGNCHGHWHYEGYAEYVLYDMAAQPLPIGHKNGFCVLDLECSGGGTATYGCSNMGISHGCGDIYSSGLDCQWIDITDVDSGLYTLVVRVNWDNDPDALGHVELNLNNNWAQACIRITEDANGNKGFVLVPNCNPYIDCAGQIYGSAVTDCNGVCNGTALMGDLDANLLQNNIDVQTYVNNSLNSSGGATDCNDLNADNMINVYDAALLNACSVYGDNYQLPTGGFHNFCEFPAGMTNINDTSYLRLGNINYTDNYVDVELLNPDNRVEAYQFKMHGINILNVVNLADTNVYDIDPAFIAGQQTVIGISYQDSSIMKSNTYKGLCRIYFSAITDTLICIESISDIINQMEERVINQITGPCITPVFQGVVSNDRNNFFGIQPNPAKDRVELNFRLEKPQDVNLMITNSIGQEILNRKLNQVQYDNVPLNLEGFSKGIYSVTVRTQTGIITRKLILD